MVLRKVVKIGRLIITDTQRLPRIVFSLVLVVSLIQVIGEVIDERSVQIVLLLGLVVAFFVLGRRISVYALCLFLLFAIAGALNLLVNSYYVFSGAYLVCCMFFCCLFKQLVRDNVRVVLKLYLFIAVGCLCYLLVGLGLGYEPGDLVFGSRNHIATLVTSYLFPIIVLYSSRGSARRDSWVPIFVAGMSALILLFYTGRGGVLIAIGLFGWILFCLLRMRNWFFYLIISFCLFFVLQEYTSLLTPVENIGISRMIGKGLINADDIRLEVFATYNDLRLVDILLGPPVGSFQEAIGIGPHNSFIQFHQFFGIIGVIALIAGGVFLFSAAP